MFAKIPYWLSTIYHRRISYNNLLVILVIENHYLLVIKRIINSLCLLSFNDQ